MSEESEEKVNGSMTEKVKKELGYMKKGAKLLPRVIGRKSKQWFKGQVEAAREQARIERQVEKEAREAELAAYKEERIEQAKLKGIAKGKRQTRGVRGTLAELGKIGDRMSVGDMIGLGDVQEKGKKVKTMSASDYMFGGLGQKEKKGEILPEGFELESVTLRRKKKKKK